MPQPRGRNMDDRLADLAGRLDILEAEQARSSPEPWRFSDQEIVEITMMQLCYIFHNDVGAYAEYLAQECGLPFEDAEERAAVTARFLEERRRKAPNPEYPL